MEKFLSEKRSEDIFFYIIYFSISDRDFPITIFFKVLKKGPQENLRAQYCYSDFMNFLLTDTPSASIKLIK